MRLAEKFLSINGEGRFAGELAVFLRFSGCNLACSYCDTMWVNEENCPTFEVSTEEICDDITESGAKRVTITGGEPLLQENLLPFLVELHGLDVSLEIETNGSVFLKPFLEEAPYVSFTMDYKMPSSNMESAMCLENLSLLRKNDTLKLVCGTMEDLHKAKELIPQVKEDVPIYLSPVFSEIKGEDMVEFMVNNKLSRLKLQLQLHKYIWEPERRGV